MSDVEVTLRLPEDLIDRLKAADLDLESVTEDVIALLEQRLARKRAWQELANIAQRLQGSMTSEEIEAELEADRAECQVKTDSE